MMKVMYTMSVMNHAADAFAPVCHAAAMREPLSVNMGTASVAVSFLREILLEPVTAAVRIRCRH